MHLFLILAATAPGGDMHYATDSWSPAAVVLGLGILAFLVKHFLFPGGRQ